MKNAVAWTITKQFHERINPLKCELYYKMDKPSHTIDHENRVMRSRSLEDAVPDLHKTEFSRANAVFPTLNPTAVQPPEPISAFR